MDVVHPGIVAVAAFEGVGQVDAFVYLGPPDVDAVWAMTKSAA